MKNLFEFVKNIPTYIWNLFKSAIDGIVDGINSILDFFSNFFTALLEFLKNIFVPGDNYFVDNYNSLNSSMSGKLGIDTGIFESLKGNASMNTYADPNFSYSFTVMGVPVTVDYSFITKIRNVTIGFSNGLMVIFLCWYNIKKVIWIIRGTSPIEGSGGAK